MDQNIPEIERVTVLRKYNKMTMRSHMLHCIRRTDMPKKEIAVLFTTWNGKGCNDFYIKKFKVVRDVTLCSL